MTREKETIVVRGIAAAIQAMAMPTFENLKQLLAKYGWRLVRDEQTNKHEDHNEG